VLVFDEIDANVGGRLGSIIGNKLRQLATRHQVLCITHLPQIAAYADTHFQIDKRVDRGRTRTTVRRLDQGGRVDELARMLGGEAISDGLRRSAREMLTERSKEEVGARGQAHRPGSQPAPQAKAKGERRKS
jgi:DNA repair protein RecN (Recombination protein N)